MGGYGLARYRKRRGGGPWSLALVPTEGGRAALEAALGASVVAFEPITPQPEPCAEPAAEAAAAAPEPPPEAAPAANTEPTPEPGVTVPEEWLHPPPPPPPPPPKPPATPPLVVPSVSGVDQYGIGRPPWLH